MKTFTKNIGTWVLDPASVVVSIPDFGPIPEMRRICKRIEDQLFTEVQVKDKEGNWVWFANSIETYDAVQHKMFHQTKHLTLGDYQGISTALNDHTILLKEFNQSNKKFSEGKSTFLNDKEVLTELTSYTDPWGKVSNEPFGTFKMKWYRANP